MITSGLDKLRTCVSYLLEILNFRNCHAWLFSNKYVYEQNFSILSTWSSLKKLNVHIKKTLNFKAPFYGRGSTASRLEPLRGGSLLFTTKFPEIPGTHFIDLGRMKGWADLGAAHCFEHGTSGLGIQHLSH